jgi:hypothetical protein
MTDEVRDTILDLVSLVSWCREHQRALTALERADLDLRLIRARRLAGEAQLALVNHATIDRESPLLVSARAESRELRAKLVCVQDAYARLSLVVEPWAEAPGAVHAAIADLGAAVS